LSNIEYEESTEKAKYKYLGLLD